MYFQGPAGMGAPPGFGGFPGAPGGFGGRGGEKTCSVISLHTRY